MASKLTEKTTIYLDPYVKKFLQLLALRKSKSMSEIINDFFAHQMQEFEKQKRKNTLADDWDFIKGEQDIKK